MWLFCFIENSNIGIFPRLLLSKQQSKNMDKQISSRALGFLVWFRKYYSGQTESTYHKIAKDYQQANYGTVRVYLLELEDCGYIQIDNKGKHSQKFTVIEQEFMKLI